MHLRPKYNPLMILSYVDGISITLGSTYVELRRWPN